MKNEYIYPKKEFSLGNLSRMQGFFRNGDFLEFAGAEIVEDLEFYDLLAQVDKGYCPIVRKGVIKVKVINGKPKYDPSVVCDRKEYLKSKKEYILNRCINEGGLYYFRFFDELNWHRCFYGNVVCDMENEYLVLRFQENKVYGSSDSEFFKLKKGPILRKNIFKIYLDFENCDGVDVYANEIVDMQLNFKKELEWSSGELIRSLKNGYINLKLDKEFLNRRINVYLTDKRATLKHVEKRICGKGKSEIDICNLYVEHCGGGYGRYYEEQIEIPDIYCDEDAIVPRLDDEEEYDIGLCVSGYAEKQKDGIIHIVFGKRLEK